ncbi:MAG: hypothetical protein K2G45_09770 [Lachnospiraceae bacterium]|nr:hypothetical protein [Lachnospiraceae bacterium]
MKKNKKIIILSIFIAVLAIVVGTTVSLMKKGDWEVFSESEGELNIMKLDENIDNNTQKINFTDTNRKGYEYYIDGSITVKGGKAKIVYYQNGKTIKEIEMEQGEHKLEHYEWNGENGAVSLSVQSTYNVDGVYNIKAYKRTSKIRDWINKNILDF